MKKYININILVAIIACVVIGVIMNNLYPLYRFHTFSGAVRYDYTVANTDINNTFTISDLVLYQDQNSSSYSSAQLAIIDQGSFEAGTTYTLKLEFLDGSSLELGAFDYEEDQSTYQSTGNSEAEALPANPTGVQAAIYQDETVIARISLVLDQATKLVADNRVMRMENVTLTSRYLRLGFLATSLDLSDYDTVVLEYRYLIADDLNPNDNNSYQVFSRVEKTPDEIMAGTTYGIFYFDQTDDFIVDRPLSVAVILQQGDDNQVTKLDFMEVSQSE